MRDQLKSLSHHWRDGAIPRGSARARKVAKQQIGVTVNSGARDEVLFSHKSRKCYFCFFGPRSSQFSFFSISSILKKKLLWHTCAGHIPLYSENLPWATKKGLAGHFRPAKPWHGASYWHGDLGLLPSPIPLLPQSSQVTDVFWCQRCREKCATDFHLITSGEQAWSPRPGHWFQNWLHDVCDHRSSVELAQWWDESVPLTEPLLLSPPQAHHRFQYLWNF